MSVRSEIHEIEKLLSPQEYDFLGYEDNYTEGDHLCTKVLKDSSNRPIAYVEIDRWDFGDGEVYGYIDVATAPQSRGKGYAYRLIKEAMYEVHSKHPEVKFMYCAKKNNTPSKNLAIRLGFKPIEIDNPEYDGFIYMFD